MKTSRSTTRFPVLCLVSVFCLVASGTLSATNVYWMSDSGTWFTPNGWLDDTPPTGVPRDAPGAADYAAILRGTVDIGLGVSVTTATASIGHWSGQLATVNLDGYWQNADYLLIGTSDDGLLNITTGGTLTSGRGILGSGVDASGTASVSGYWNNSEALIIGSYGNGTLLVETSGTLISGGDITAFGNFADASGTAIVSGLWQSTGALYIGSSGSGSLIVEASGTVLSAGSSRVGYDSTAVGEAIVRGYWNNNGTLVVGGTGKGTLEIASTGTLINGNFYGSDYEGSESKISVGGYWQSGQIVIGQRGTSTVDILDGGIMTTTSTTQHILLGNTAGGNGIINVKEGGYMYAGNQVRVGIVAGGTGTLNIESGATVEANLGVYASLGNGYGVINIATGGTLIINTNALYVGNGGAGNANSYGEVNIDGYVRSGNGTYYTPVGYAGVGVLNIGATGTMIAGQLDIGREATASGTVIIAGYYQHNASNTLVGSLGNGTLIIKDGGVLNITTGRINVGANGAGTGVVIVEAGGLINYTAMTSGAPSGGNFYLGNANAGSTSTGTAFISGTIRNVNTFYIGETNSGNNTFYLYEGGYMNVINNSWFGRNAGSSAGLNTAYIDGYWYTGGYLRVAENGTAVMNIGPTGVVEVRTTAILGSTANTQGSAFLEGTFQVGTSLTLGNAASAYGYLNVASSGTLKTGTDLIVGASGTGRMEIGALSVVTAGGNYRQNAASVLRVELDVSRADDPLNPDITAPLLQINGAATLSGTLLAHGNAIPTIPEFKWDSNGYARSSMLTGIPVLRASGGITGDFTIVIIDGLNIPDTLPDFISGGGLKVNEGGPMDTRYDIGYGLAWKGGTDDAHGNFTIESGKTFEVDVQLDNRPSGVVFASGWDGKSLTLTGSNQGTLILSVENAYSGATTVESGTLRFTGPAQHNLGALINSGVIDFYGTATDGRRIGGYRTITANSLVGNNGTFRMGVDLSTGASDRLIIDGDAYGTHRLLITGTAAGLPRGDEPTPTLVTIGGVNGTTITGEGEIIGSGTITTFSGNFDYGLFKYEVQTLGNRVVIVNTGLAPDVFEHINGVPGSQSVLWFDQQDNISRRLGELRAPREGGTGFDIWARGHASSSTIGGGESEMLKSDVDIWGAEIGSDYTWKFDDQHATVGVYLGIGNASQKFERIATALSNSTGESDVLGIGVYASWLADSGWFANATASMAQYKNSFDSVDGSKNHTTADYKDHGFGVAIEGGRRFEVSSNGWFVEPAVQGAAVRLTRADYIAVNKAQNYELSVHGSDITVTRLRGAIRVGRAWKAGRAGWMEIAGRFGATRERSSGGEVVITSAPVNRWRPNLDGNRYEAGVGFFWQPFETGQLYFDYEYASGDNFTKPWGISLGFRLSL